MQTLLRILPGLALLLRAAEAAASLHPGAGPLTGWQRSFCSQQGVKSLKLQETLEIYKPDFILLKFIVPCPLMLSDRYLCFPLRYRFACSSFEDVTQRRGIFIAELSGVQNDQKMDK